MDHLDAIYEAVLNGDEKTAVSATKSALVQGLEPAEILTKGCIAAMTEVGELFEAGELFVPEMVIAARAMKEVMGLLKPLLVGAELVTRGTVVLGTVAGDMHDIGKNLVGMMLEGAGYQVVDLGTNVAADRFVTAVREHQPDVVGLSSLLTTTMPGIESVLVALEEAGLRARVKVIVGGAPITPQFAEEVGADGFAKDAAGAPRLVKRLLS